MRTTVKAGVFLLSVSRYMDDCCLELLPFKLNSAGHALSLRPFGVSLDHGSSPVRLKHPEIALEFSKVDNIGTGIRDR